MCVTQHCYISLARALTPTILQPLVCVDYSIFIACCDVYIWVCVSPVVNTDYCNDLGLQVFGIGVMYTPLHGTEHANCKVQLVRITL